MLREPEVLLLQKEHNMAAAASYPSYREPARYVRGSRIDSEDPSLPSYEITANPQPYLMGVNAQVYRGEMTLTDGRKVPVALRFSKGSSRTHQLVFETERLVLERLALLGVPHLLPIVGVGEIKGRRFHVFPWGGKDLFCHIEKKHMSENQALYWTFLIAQILKVLHERELVHTDVKGENFVSPDGEKILYAIDLGGARKAGGLTAFDLRRGTPPYASLEVLFGVPPRPPEDIFALAHVLVTMCTRGFLYRPGESSCPHTKPEDRASWLAIYYLKEVVRCLGSDSVDPAILEKLPLSERTISENPLEKFRESCPRLEPLVRGMMAVPSRRMTATDVIEAIGCAVAKVPHTLPGGIEITLYSETETLPPTGPRSETGSDPASECTTTESPACATGAGGPPLPSRA